MDTRTERERPRGGVVTSGAARPPTQLAAGARQANRRVASRLDEVAALLEAQRANPFRVRAWRRAADVVRGLPVPVASIVSRQGTAGLDAIPGIGNALARAIVHLVERGRLPMLDRLRGDVDPEALLRTVPGVGRALARRLHEELGISTLEELEAAAHDGRLAALPGFGSKRLAGIRDSLASRLQRRPGWQPSRSPQPDVGELLDVDREYRERAARGELGLVAPRRFNPAGEAWLPILHTTRGARHYTALFSNTARAHQLGRTRDWVVIYCDGRDGEQRFTVVTSWAGPLAGRRVVRGREGELAHFGARRPPGPAAA